MQEAIFLILTAPQAHATAALRRLRLNLAGGAT